jgi:archaellin
MTDPRIYFFIAMVVVTAILAASVIIDAMGGEDQ